MNFILSVTVLLSLAISCSATPKDVNGKSNIYGEDGVEVFYFHFSRRCATCLAVEKESEAIVRKLYQENVTFTAYDIEEAEGKAKAGELGVSGQTLLIVRGDTRINITNEAFMYARSAPEKLKWVIQEKIDPLL